MKSKKLGQHVALSLIAAGPAGGFLLGLLHAGDPDPNPIGRIAYAGLMAVQTPLHAGFPPRQEAGVDQSFNAWPCIAISFLLIFSWLASRERKTDKRQKDQLKASVS